MYQIVEVVQKIKSLAREKGIKTTEMLTACELSKNALSSMSNRGSWIQANSLAKIADYLDCSVDYLLGRTDTPKPETENIINTGDIMPIANGDNSISAGVIVGSKATEDVNELLGLIQGLPLVKRAEAIIYLNNLKNGSE